MSMKRSFAAACAALGVAVYASAAFAAGYPTQTCVSAKLKAAASRCQADLKAWSKWDGDQDTAKRDAALAKNVTKLNDAWSKAEAKSAAKGVDCTDTTLSATDTGTAMDSGVADIVNAINSGVTLPDSCAAKLVGVAAKKCKGLLKAESKYVKKLDAAARDADQTKASTKFSGQFVTTGCSTTATEPQVEGLVDDLSDALTSGTTVSPNIPTTWTAVTPTTCSGGSNDGGKCVVASECPGGGTCQTSIEYSNYTNQFGSHTLTPMCSRITPYMYWVKRGTGADANKLLMYYQGGGACWDDTTCSPSLSPSPFDNFVTNGDNPANTTTGFGDLNNPDNPFRNWSAVFVSYCTGDIHWGDNARFYHDPLNGGQTYPLKHFGYENAKVAEKFAREHFVAPEEVFVTGSSAGAYGAVLHGIELHNVFTGAHFNVVGDAGNGVVTPTFISTNFEPAWSVQQHLPSYIPGLDADITSLTISDLYGRSAAFFAPRDSRFAMYATAWDGGGGSQTFFYNVMVNGILDNGSWWHSSCGWNTQAKQNDVAAYNLAPNNFRYYIGPGSRHTIYGSNRVYTETHGGVPTFADWVNDMREGDPGWVNVECTDCSLLGSCNGGTNSGASCQHDSECPGGVCNLVDAKPPFTCNGASVNSGAACQRDADCVGVGAACNIEASFGVCSANSTSNAYRLCANASDCPGGTCVTQQPFQLDGVVSCPP